MKKLYLLLPILMVQSIFAQTANLIREESLMKRVEFLTSPKLQGRLAGSEYYNAAASYGAEEFGKAGLKPFGGEKYFQYLNIEYNQILPGEEFSVIRADGSEKKCEIGKDYIYRGFSGSGNITAPVVFCGYGISDSLYDDYKSVDLNGKIAMVFKYQPKWNIEKHVWQNGNPREKARIAFQHGAVGILYVSFPNDDKPQLPIASVISGSGEQNINFPELHIDLPIADEILNGTEFTLKNLQTKIDSTKNPFSVSTKNKVKIKVETDYAKEKKTMNVVGLLEGKDDKLKNEYIIIGAHLDHVGGQGGKVYFPGANDNASGSAAVMEIAHAFAEGKIENKRSIIFVLFTCEEQGLYGAKYLANHLPVKQEQVVAMMNMDCVGFGDSIQIGNGKSAPQLWQIAKQIDVNNDKMMIETTWNGGGADAAPFHDKGIPAIYFVTKNSYEHLHELTDKPETLNKSLYQQITKLAFLTVKEIAEGKYQKENVLK
ncbi:MAG: M20/M25/M40 family metallo-hydrolase [Ignavibacteriaceae bacterium]|nr:M20/M25/M40 family metallo-hydrolase [Ignavibacteriaceae bacterium]